MSKRGRKKRTCKEQVEKMGGRRKWMRGGEGQNKEKNIFNTNANQQGLTWKYNMALLVWKKGFI